MSVHPTTKQAWAVSNKTTLDKKPRMTMKQHLFAILTDFCNNTSMHGLGQVSRNTIGFAKFVWFIAVLVGTAGIVFHLSILVTLYLERPIQEVTKTLNQPIPFPDVTVCSLDPISKSNYEHILQNKTSRLSGYFAKLQQMQEAGVITEDQMARYKSIRNTRNNIGIEESKAIGYQLKDLILRCVFRGRQCNITHNFKWIINAILYNCYTFDPGEKADHFVATGPENGLSLLFYLEATNGSQLNAEYNTLLNNVNALGVKVVIHPRGIYPVPHIEGIEIMPGHSTSVAFQVTNTTRLPLPYGDCIYNQTLTGFNSYKYTTTSCLNTCLQKRFMDVCGCMTIYEPIPDDDGVYCGRLADIPDLNE
jgi:hypothetical protein